MTDIAWICSAVIFVLWAILFGWALYATSKAGKVSALETATSDSEEIAERASAMTSAQANAAPDDAALDRRLANGTFGFIVLFCMGMLMSACSGRPVMLCPSLVAYSSTEENALRQELASSALPQTHRFIRDYGGLRDQVRACQGKTIGKNN
ncbi:MAG: hypothetical protein LKH33_10405 [Acetobacter sp.]|jgi:hypothetical protein|nr:hypothetical protein [Acetobacter sp.]MCH4060551.1 hypothetical protein [Acetobacter sp.]MCH4087491.1 hypothetical protein [Acetobacter sp.]MCI1294692.1 hypothetical protein [Acetobacter sp.]MCI1321159.1 hypothetical protein [Acetobacter sp.]